MRQAVEEFLIATINEKSAAKRNNYARTAKGVRVLIPERVKTRFDAEKIVKNLSARRGGALETFPPEKKKKKIADCEPLKEKMQIGDETLIIFAAGGPKKKRKPQRRGQNRSEAPSSDNGRSPNKGNLGGVLMPWMRPKPGKDAFRAQKFTKTT